MYLVVEEGSRVSQSPRRGIGSPESGDGYYLIRERDGLNPLVGESALRREYWEHADGTPIDPQSPRRGIGSPERGITVTRSDALRAASIPSSGNRLSGETSLYLAAAERCAGLNPLVGESALRRDGELVVEPTAEPQSPRRGIGSPESQGVGLHPPTEGRTSIPSSGNRLSGEQLTLLS